MKLRFSIIDILHATVMLSVMLGVTRLLYGYPFFQIGFVLSYSCAFIVAVAMRLDPKSESKVTVPIISVVAGLTGVSLGVLAPYYGYSSLYWLGTLTSSVIAFIAVALLLKGISAVIQKLRT